MNVIVLVLDPATDVGVFSSERRQETPYDAYRFILACQQELERGKRCWHAPKNEENMTLFAGTCKCILVREDSDRDPPFNFR